MKKILPLFIIACLPLSISPSTFADNKGFEGWYQIEVIIFNQSSSSNQEASPKDITLKYPLNWESLKRPGDNTPETPSNATSTDSLTTSDNNRQENQPVTTIDTQSSEPLDNPDSTIAFLTLAKSDRLLNTIATRLARRQNYRVLFHEAWQQIVTHESTAPSILIFGGDKFGEHYELEGSINVNVSRYLHLQTNLWFSEFQVNTGQSRYEWPELPKNPKTQLELINRTDESEEFSFTNNKSSLTTHSYSLEPWTNIAVNSDLPNFLSSPYLPANITTLQQKRRMRSKEIHYIDHPTLGIIIKIIPYELPEKTNVELMKAESIMNQTDK